MNLPNFTTLQNGKYRITRFIASGGFGCTYQAINTYTNQAVAIKELFVKDVSDRDEKTLTINAYSTNKFALLQKVKRKFLEEANALISMSHPNIVRVYESFEENGTAYYVMDYIDGVSLNEIVKHKGPLPEQKALKYINQIADALAYVHGRNRLHLDIKPANIMIDKYDNAILIDFGVSKQYDEEAGENTSTVIGKSPEYSPIEQLGNNIQQFSPSTDIYALGATLYKCVTGKTPISASLLASGEELEPLSSSISENVRNSIIKAMALDKRNRPQTISEFIAIIKQMPKKDCPHSQNEKQEGKGISSYGCIFILFLITIIIVLFNYTSNQTETTQYNINPNTTQSQSSPQSISQEEVKITSSNKDSNLEKNQHNTKIKPELINIINEYNQLS